MDFLTVLINVAVLLALAVPGFILRKTKMINETAISAFVVVLMYVNQPFLLVNSFLTSEYSSDILLNMGIVLALSFFFILLMFFIAKFFYQKHPDIDNKKVYSYAVMFSNCGFMGIPVIQALFPGNAEALIYVSLFNIAFNTLNWTLGIYILSGKREYISIKKVALNPATIAVAIGLIFFFFKVPMPKAVANGVSLIGNMTTPMAMLVTGIRLAEMPFKDIFKGFNAYIVSFLRLIVSPILTFAVLSVLGISPLIKSVLIIIMAMPCAVTTIAFSERYGANSVEGVKCVLLSTILSVLTIPVLMSFLC